MDRAGLRSIEQDPAYKNLLKDFDDEVTALLIETRAINDEQLDIQINQMKSY